MRVAAKHLKDVFIRWMKDTKVVGIANGFESCCDVFATRYLLEMQLDLLVSLDQLIAKCGPQTDLSRPTVSREVCVLPRLTRLAGCG